MSREEFNTREDQRKAAFKRRRDAEILVSLGDKHALAAMYLGGYAIECKLKATAMEAYGCQTLRELARKWDVPDATVYSHGLEAIFVRLRLYNNFRNSPAFYSFVNEVNKWRPSWRYDARDRKKEQAEAFVEAVKVVYNWLESNRY